MDAVMLWAAFAGGAASSFAALSAIGAASDLPVGGAGGFSAAARFSAAGLACDPAGGVAAIVGFTSTFAGAAVSPFAGLRATGLTGALPACATAGDCARSGLTATPTDGAVLSFAKPSAAGFAGRLIGGGAGGAASSTRPGVAFATVSPALARAVCLSWLGLLTESTGSAALGGRDPNAPEDAAGALVGLPEVVGSKGGLCAAGRGGGWRAASIPESAIDGHEPDRNNDSLKR
ncbi:MAG: hypothetical protein ABSE69_10530 [Roseiarcus sp.]|jgi:hypothetical protein